MAKLSGIVCGLIRRIMPAPGLISLGKLFDGAGPNDSHSELIPDLPEGLRLQRLCDSKRVQKKWGYELWFAYDRAPFACKGIFIRKGFRTSLQWHRKKEEALLLLSGRALLSYRNSVSDRTRSTEIAPGTLIHVRPNTIHRLEALTDLYLIEVSSPELEDVIRVEDDWNRPDGRVEQEHNLPTRS
jgi:mannose-6-phosphate isomerase-like protein (cupin superfamily)